MVSLTSLRAKEVILSGPNYSDRSIDDLLRLKHVEVIRLWRTTITDAGIERIRQALPDCDIIRG